MLIQLTGFSGNATFAGKGAIKYVSLRHIATAIARVVAIPCKCIRADKCGPRSIERPTT